MGTTTPVRPHSCALSAVAVASLRGECRQSEDHRERGAEGQMQCRSRGRARNSAACHARRKHKRFHELGRRPLNHHRGGEDARGGQGPERRFRAPRDRNGCGREQRKGRECHTVMVAVDDQKSRGKQKCADRPGGHPVNFPRLGGRAVFQPGHDKCGRKRKTRNDVEQVCRQCLDVVGFGAGPRPEHAHRRRSDRKPSPKPHAGQSEGRRHDNGEIEIERPVVRRSRADEDRRDEGADHAEARKRRAMQKRGRQCRQGHKAEQDECEGRRQETVKREGRINGRVGCDCAGCSENAGNVLAWNWDDTGSDLVPPRPLAGRDQERRENRGEKYPDAGTEQSHLDGVANEENAAERERKAADPDDPLRAEPFLQRCRRAASDTAGAGAAGSGISGAATGSTMTGGGSAACTGAAGAGSAAGATLG